MTQLMIYANTNFIFSKKKRKLTQTAMMIFNLSDKVPNTTISYLLENFATAIQSILIFIRLQNKFAFVSHLSKLLVNLANVNSVQ